MIQHDSLQRFLFEAIGVRGEIVRLDQSWREVLGRHDYPPAVREQLGQALAAVLLLAATIKFKGSLILQAQGSGPLRTLVAQASESKAVRGIARWEGDVPSGSLEQIFGTGRLVLTIQSEGAEPYQGVVPLEGENLTTAIETYFRRSEQLATRLWLFADEHTAVGLFLQQMPAHAQNLADWDRVAMLADTITAKELMNIENERLLYRLFHEETVRLFEAERVRFRCTCSRDRIERVLCALGQPEVDGIIAEHGNVEVHCEFCNRLYQFDAVDTLALFTEGTLARGSARRH